MVCLLGINLLQGCFNKTFAQSDTTTQIKNYKPFRFTALPFLSFTPESSLQIGGIGTFVIQTKDTLNRSKYYRPINISPILIYTLNNQMIFITEADVWFGKGWNSYTYFRFFLYPDFFYGLGSDTRAEDVERYGNDFVRATGRLVKSIDADNKLFAGLSYDLQYDNIFGLKQGGLLQQLNPLGVKGGFLDGVGATVRYDSRNNTLYPTKGFQISVDALRFGTVGNYNFNNLLIDIRQYISIGSYKNVFAYQVFGNFTYNDEIPFYKLPRLGGVNLMRGIIENRFRDRQSAFLQAEYRRVIGRFGLAAFTGVGVVAPSIDQFSSDNFKYIGGLGFRFSVFRDERLNIRLDYGMGTGGQSGIYLAFREAF